MSHHEDAADLVRPRKSLADGLRAKTSKEVGLLRLEVPASFRQMPRWWSEGSDWLDRLPDVAEALCLEWQLRPVARPMHGSNALVILVQRGTEQLVLKLTPPGPAVTDEVTALRFWAGRGTVHLIDVDLDRGAMLLERLDATRTPARLDLLEAMTVVGSLARRLAIPAPEDVPTTMNIARSLAKSLPSRWQRLGEPFDRALLHEAVELAEQLGEHDDAGLAVNADLHHEQVLAARREPWLAVDPILLRGDPQYDFARAMWTRLDEMPDVRTIRRSFDRLATAAEIPLEAARTWAALRCVDYWLWGLEHGLTEDPQRCSRLIAAL